MKRVQVSGQELGPGLDPEELNREGRTCFFLSELTSPFWYRLKRKKSGELEGKQGYRSKSNSK